MGESYFGVSIRPTFLAGVALGTAAGFAACALALRKLPEVQERVFGPIISAKTLKRRTQKVGRPCCRD
eukprot:7128289-Pyramimonas_sp.AAC.1